MSVMNCQAVTFENLNAAFFNKKKLINIHRCVIYSPVNYTYAQQTKYCLLIIKNQTINSAAGENKWLKLKILKARIKA